MGQRISFGVGWTSPTRRRHAMTTLDSNTRLLAFTAESIAPYEGELAA
jgi:hypothetical protein